MRGGVSHREGQAYSHPLQRHLSGVSVDRSSQQVGERASERFLFCTSRRARCTLYTVRTGGLCSISQGGAGLWQQDPGSAGGGNSE